MRERERKKPDYPSSLSHFLLQLPMAIRGTARKKPGTAKTHPSGKDTPERTDTYTQTLTRRALWLLGKVPCWPWGGFILILLGWLVSLRQVIHSGWDRGTLCITPVANWRHSTASSETGRELQSGRELESVQPQQLSILVSYRLVILAMESWWVSVAIFQLKAFKEG